MLPFVYPEGGRCDKQAYGDVPGDPLFEFVGSHDFLLRFLPVISLLGHILV